MTTKTQEKYEAIKKKAKISKRTEYDCGKCDKIYSDEVDAEFCCNDLKEQEEEKNKEHYKQINALSYEAGRQLTEQRQKFEEVLNELKEFISSSRHFPKGEYIFNSSQKIMLKYEISRIEKALNSSLNQTHNTLADDLGKSSPMIKALVRSGDDGVERHANIQEDRGSNCSICGKETLFGLDLCSECEQDV